MHADTAPPPAADAAAGRGFTISDISRRFRVKRGKVLNWIRERRLAAVNTADPPRVARWVDTSEGLMEFERQRTAAPAKPARRKKRTMEVDYFPD
jgi:hypothetical protein